MEIFYFKFPAQLIINFSIYNKHRNLLNLFFKFISDILCIHMYIYKKYSYSNSCFFYLPARCSWYYIEKSIKNNIKSKTAWASSGSLGACMELSMTSGTHNWTEDVDESWWIMTDFKSVLNNNNNYYVCALHTNFFVF